MALDIIINEQDIQLTAELNDTQTARIIAEALPLEGRVNVWGEEIYFSIPVQIDLAPDAVTEVPVGTLAYWPTGRALCIFFGPTPVSVNNQPRAYSPVNVFGRIKGDATVLKQVSDGAIIRIRSAKEA